MKPATWVAHRVLLPDRSAGPSSRPQPVAQYLADKHAFDLRYHGCLLLMLITTELWQRIFLHEGGRRPDYGWSDCLGR
jgi:hypothetical protein